MYIKLVYSIMRRTVALLPLPTMDTPKTLPGEPISI